MYVLWSIFSLHKIAVRFEYYSMPKALPIWDHMGQAGIIPFLALARKCFECCGFESRCCPLAAGPWGQRHTDLPTNWEQIQRCKWQPCTSGTLSLDRDRLAILTNIFWSCLYLFKYRTTLCTGLATLDSGHTCTKWFYWLTIKNPLLNLTICSNSRFCFSEKYKVVVDDLPSALEDVHPSPFCEPCERNGKLKMTAGTYCVNCERKLCAAHQKVCITDPSYV